MNNQLVEILKQQGRICTGAFLAGANLVLLVMDVFSNKNQVIWTMRVKLLQIQSECARVIEIKPNPDWEELEEKMRRAKISKCIENLYVLQLFPGHYTKT